MFLVSAAPLGSCDVNDLCPIAIEELPSTFEAIASLPIATFKPPVVNADKAPCPIPTLSSPVVIASKAVTPIPMLFEAVLVVELGSLPKNIELFSTRASLSVLIDIAAPFICNELKLARPDDVIVVNAPVDGDSLPIATPSISPPDI